MPLRIGGSEWVCLFLKITLKKSLWHSPQASSQVRQLKPIFNALAAVHQAYIDGERGRDCPFWYSERPNVGLLAAAVWQCRGTALEGYGTHKTKGEERKRGRCDLHIRIGRLAFDCEAKRVWMSLGGRQKPKQRQSSRRVRMGNSRCKKSSRRQTSGLMFRNARNPQIEAGQVAISSMDCVRERLISCGLGLNMMCCSGLELKKEKSLLPASITYPGTAFGRQRNTVAVEFGRVKFDLVTVSECLTALQMNKAKNDSLVT